MDVIDNSVHFTFDAPLTGSLMPPDVLKSKSQVYGQGIDVATLTVVR